MVIAQKFPSQERRFTTAHEIAHYVLHKDRALHRDRAINGTERTRHRSVREWTEQEADFFAAKLLMPTQLLIAEFVRRFSGAIGLASLNDEVCSAFGGSLLGATPNEIRRRGVEWLAPQLADANIFNGNLFDPLTRVFGVSKSAMGIELAEVKLVNLD
jgi:hypothetical protein